MSYQKRPSCRHPKNFCPCRHEGRLELLHGCKLLFGIDPPWESTPSSKNCPPNVEPEKRIGITYNFFAPAGFHVIACEKLECAPAGQSAASLEPLLLRLGRHWATPPIWCCLAEPGRRSSRNGTRRRACPAGPLVSPTSGRLPSSPRQRDRRRSGTPYTVANFVRAVGRPLQTEL